MPDAHEGRATNHAAGTGLSEYRQRRGCLLRRATGPLRGGRNKKENLLLDPGFGFGKNLSHNYELLARLSDFHHFGRPLLVGMSRKSMIGQLLNVGPGQRLTGSLACAVIAAMQGAHIIRVHDVKETVEAMRVVEATQRAKG